MLCKQPKVAISEVLALFGIAIINKILWLRVQQGDDTDSAPERGSWIQTLYSA
jgi:hypothetical protein